ncbi:hypothetical protein V5O48_013433 [Marasmius crinis-equi]|uniref:Magnesium-dependent phosphatase-1 n=1 Tax=Marasmius crinis-equi TaxID=585013 RepID=A0ABR3F0H2_9AGAR
MKPSTTSDERMPKLVVFDLDYTLWDMWIDTHVTGPLRREKNTHNEILDKHGEVISFYNHVPQILHRLREAGVKIAVASRTSAPTLKIHEKTGIPYEEMVFYDDEHRNKETEQLGVTFCLVRRQMDHDTFEKGLAEWRRRHPAPPQEDEE